MTPAISTIEELIDMNVVDLKALPPEQLEELFAAAIAKQEAIFSALPAPKSGHVNLAGSTSKRNIVATAILQESMTKYGVTPDMLARFGIKTK